MKNFLPLFLLCLLCACRDDADGLINPTQVEPHSYVEQFDAFWHGMNSGYVFWSNDTTDWDRVRRAYRPRFLEWDEQGEAPTQDLESTYREMVAGLLDRHYCLTVTNLKAPSESFTIYPGIEDLRRRPDFHPAPEVSQMNTLYDALIAQQRLSDFSRAQCQTSQGLMHVAAGLIDRATLYLRFSRFAFTELLSLKNPRGDSADVLDVYDRFSELLLLTKTKSLILDLRGNNGGYNNDINLLTARLIDSPLLLASTRHKQGLGRLDYSPWIPYYVFPNFDLPRRTNLRLVVLVDCWSGSMSELTAKSIELIGGTVVGERTYGATGPLTLDYDLYYSGPFSTADNSLSVVTSLWQLKFTDGKLLEGVGLSPSLNIPWNSSDFSLGVDPQLQAALDFLSSNP